MQRINRKNTLAFTSAAIFSLCSANGFSVELFSTSFFESDEKPKKPEEEPIKSEEPPKRPVEQASPFGEDLFNRDKVIFFGNVELLYWVVNEGAVDYAVKMKHRPWSSKQDTFAVGSYQSARFDWNPGFKLSFGYSDSPHYWDIFVQYAYLPISGSNVSYAPKREGQFLNGTWIQPDMNTGHPPVPLRKAESHIKLDYHVVDLLFSISMKASPLRFNIFGGLTSAFLYQNWNVSYVDIFNQSSKIRNKWQYEGIGLRIGTKIDWFLGIWDLYFTGLTSTAVVSGWYKNSAFQKTDADIPDADNSRPVFNVHFHDTRMTYNVQFLAGPSWQKRFEGLRMEVLAGYEFNIWTNLHQIYRSSFDAPTAAKETFINDSDISLQGLTLRVNIDF